MKMQRKKIEYSGISTSPDDYVSADGQLALSHNMLIEDGGVKAVGEANVVLGHVDGDVVYIHKNPDYDKPHYIIIRGKNKDRLNYVGGDSNDDIVINGEFKQCTSVGHTLIVLTTKEMLYVQWKGGRYLKLGNSLPEISVDFTTQGYFGQNGSLNIDRDSLVVMDSAYYADAEALKAQKAKISIRPLATTLDSLSYNYPAISTVGHRTRKTAPLSREIILIPKERITLGCLPMWHILPSIRISLLPVSKVYRLCLVLSVLLGVCMIIPMQNIPLPFWCIIWVRNT